MANFENNFNKKMTSLGYMPTYFDKYLNDCDNNLKKCTNLYIGFCGNESIQKNIKLPLKKIVTVEYILNKLVNDKIYINFSKYFNKLIKNLGFNVYPTSYGIGVTTIFNRNKKENIEQINNLLNNLGIEFTNEYSDAYYVYRYKISKSQKNINKIKDCKI